MSVKKKKLPPHGRFTLLWILHVVAGGLLGYAAIGHIDWSCLLAAVIAITALANLQHCVHVLKGMSSTQRIEEYDVVSLLRLTVICFFIIIICLTYLMIMGRWLILIPGALGIWFCLAYGSRPSWHREELWGLAWVIGMPASMYAACGTIHIPMTIIQIGLAILCTSILICYRSLTGDYDHSLELRKKMLMKAYLSYNIGLALMAIGGLVWALT